MADADVLNVLSLARERFESGSREWIEGTFWRDSDGMDMSATMVVDQEPAGCCLVGALLEVAIDLGYIDPFAAMTDDDDVSLMMSEPIMEAVTGRLFRVLPAAWTGTDEIVWQRLSTWNDAKAQSVDDVTDLLERAAR